MSPVKRLALLLTIFACAPAFAEESSRPLVAWETGHSARSRETGGRLVSLESARSLTNIPSKSAAPILVGGARQFEVEEVPVLSHQPLVETADVSLRSSPEVSFSGLDDLHALAKGEA